MGGLRPQVTELIGIVKNLRRLTKENSNENYFSLKNNFHIDNRKSEKFSYSSVTKQEKQDKKGHRRTRRRKDMEQAGAKASGDRVTWPESFLSEGRVFSFCNEAAVVRCREWRMNGKYCL